jgi:DNA-binding helix-hairpin-helix protein with protein kinase domain
MESYGVESANDVEQFMLAGIPSIDSEAMMELLQWRARIEKDFTFNPDHGVTITDLKAAKETAVRRFKLSQARKVLATSKQIDSLVAAEKVELSRALGSFNEAVARWKTSAKELRDFQGGRRRIERWVNSSAGAIVAASLLIPLVAGIVYLIATR